MTPRLEPGAGAGRRSGAVVELVRIAGTVVLVAMMSAVQAQSAGKVKGRSAVAKGPTQPTTEQERRDPDLPVDGFDWESINSLSDANRNGLEDEFEVPPFTEFFRCASSGVREGRAEGDSVDNSEFASVMTLYGRQLNPDFPGFTLVLLDSLPQGAPTVRLQNSPQPVSTGGFSLANGRGGGFRGEYSIPRGMADTTVVVQLMFAQDTICARVRLRPLPRAR